MNDTKNLTLWDIESELMALLDLREEMAAKAESLEAVDNQIAEYVQREARKVDKVRGFLKHAKLMELGAKDEAAAYRAKAETWAGRAQRVKDFCVQALRMADKKKFEGASGSLSRQADGGRQAVEIMDASLVPEEYCTYELKMTAEQFKILERDLLGNTVAIARIVQAAKVGEACAKPCFTCDGTGKLIKPDTSTPGMVSVYEETCNDCGGDKMARVPGARLTPRGEHLVVR